MAIDHKIHLVTIYKKNKQFKEKILKTFEFAIKVLFVALNSLKWRLV